MTLTLVSAELGYNVYEDTDGDEVIATPLPVAQPLTMWEDFDLSSAWFAAVVAHRDNPPARWSYRPDQYEFVLQITREVADQGEVSVVWCESCDEPVKGDEAESVDNGTAHACSSCFEENYRSCGDCGAIVHYESTTYTMDDHSVCDSCRDGSYSYCENCDSYYHDSDESEHAHGGCDCAPPTLSVQFPQADGTVLTQDERVSVSLPAGVISEEGILAISRLIRNHGDESANAVHGTEEEADAAWKLRNKWWNLSQDVTTMDARWQTKEGNFTKRLSKLAHKSQDLKFPPALLTKVGNIARDNSQGTDIEVELTRDLNLPAEDFYHEDSCWWQSYSESRCSLKNNGGIGMRTFGGTRYQPVSGRAWIMPLRQDEDGALQPTFDATAADAYMVFNGYGDLSGYTPARVVAGMTGMTYRKISFDCSPMYVNGETGYLVASEEIVTKYATDGRLSLYADTHSNLYNREQSAALVAA